MLKPNDSPDNKLDREVRAESHRRMSAGQLEFSQLSTVGKITRTVMIECVEVSHAEEEVREELTVFQAELDISGLAEDR
jgi:hypothetical protein